MIEQSPTKDSDIINWSNLTITNVTNDDVGSYHCIGRDNSGNQVEAKFTLESRMSVILPVFELAAIIFFASALLGVIALFFIYLCRLRREKIKKQGLSDSIEAQRNSLLGSSAMDKSKNGERPNSIIVSVSPSNNNEPSSYFSVQDVTFLKHYS